MAYGKRPSGPRAAEILRQLRQEVQQGWRPGLTLLTGDDAYHLDAAQKTLLEALVPDGSSDFALTVFAEQAIDVSKLLAAVRSAGMFAPRRVVLVRDIAIIEGEPKALIDYAAAPPPDSFLLIRATKLDLRRKLHQAIKKNAHVLELAQPAPQGAAALVGDVVGLAAGKGLALDRRAAAFLTEVCAADFYRIDGELEKIRCWIGAGEGAKVGLAEVQETVAASGLLSGWEVANAILQRDRAGALAALRQLIDSGSEPLMLLGGLAYRSRGMLRAKALIGSGARPDRALREAGLWGGGSTETMAKGLGRYSQQDLLRFPSLLLQADRTLKSRSISPRAVLENLVDRLTTT